jgi:hypothetical protein
MAMAGSVRGVHRPGRLDRIDHGASPGRTVRGINSASVSGDRRNGADQDQADRGKVPARVPHPRVNLAGGYAFVAPAQQVYVRGRPLFVLMSANELE